MEYTIDWRKSTGDSDFCRISAYFLRPLAGPATLIYRNAGASAARENVGRGCARGCGLPLEWSQADRRVSSGSCVL